ncbi:MAG: hypothetical protein JWQ66_3574, partial [Mucilaginibacter sp.]|nr:hypothetical protein [Mucilaginibacter sp.]
PIPGSPPIKTNDPATMPPPKTRLNSLSGVSRRCSSSKVISETSMGLLERWVEVELAFQLGMDILVFSIISSTRVFHCPQEGHLPSHFGDSKPQLWQKYATFVLANVFDVQICGCANVQILLEYASTIAKNISR